MQNWRSTSCVSGRVAVEEDVKAGRAVFYLQDAEKIGAKSNDLVLPSCAVLFDEESGEEVLVIIIQAEETEEADYIGYRLLDSGNGICTLAEVEFLGEPDERFFQH